MTSKIPPGGLPPPGLRGTGPSSHSKETHSPQSTHTPTPQGTPGKPNTATRTANRPPVRSGRPQQKERAKRSRGSRADSFGGLEEHEEHLNTEHRGDSSHDEGFAGKEEEEKWKQAVANRKGPGVGNSSGKDEAKAKRKDDFDTTAAKAEALKNQNAINAPSLRRLPGDPKDAMQVLHNAQDAGVFFQEREAGQGEEEIPPDLLAAVQKVIAQFPGVKGFLRASPGRDEEGAWIIVVSVARGFTKGSFASLPEEVDGFRTLLALPFDALPLRRDSL